MKTAVKGFWLGLVIVMLGAAVSFAAPTPVTYTLDTRGESTGIMSNGGVAVFYSDEMQSSQSSGTGVINPFLTTQANGYESGINSDSTDFQYNEKRAGAKGDRGFTHSLQYSDLRLSPFAGLYPNYISFSVDINQTSSTPLIDLTNLRIFVVPQALGATLNTIGALEANGTEVFSLDNAINDYTIQIFYGDWKGSGNNMDMALFIPQFSAKPGDYIYMYIQYDNSNDGPDEWVIVGNRTVPEPATMLLLGLGVIGLAGVKRFRQ